MRETKIANWQNVDSRLAHVLLVGCFSETVIEIPLIYFRIGFLPKGEE